MENINDSQNYSLPIIPRPQACSTEHKKGVDSSPLKQTPGRFPNAMESVETNEPDLKMLAGFKAIQERINALFPEKNCLENHNALTKLDENNDSLSWALPTNSTDTEFMVDVSFSKLLNVSDLERDEILCRQNWTHLPLEKVNFSVTGVDNSKIIPPNFMPAEDSLFKDLKYSSEDSCIKTITNELKTANIHEINKSNLEGAAISSLNSILENCDNTLSVPSIKDISLALRSCEENASPRTLLDKVLRAGEKTSLCSKMPDDDNISTYEDSLIWGSVDVGSAETYSVHILNKCGYFFEILLEGSSSFQIYDENKICDNGHISSFTATSNFHKLFVMFCPKNIGPKSATLAISSPSLNTKKTIKLCGFGGRSNVVLNNIVWNLSNGVKQLHITRSPELSTNLELRNLGESPAFFYICFGDLEEYFSVQHPSGILYPGDKKIVCLYLTKNRKFLSSLLNVFNGNIVEIGKIIVYYGEEATRQRLIRLCNILGAENVIKMIFTNYSCLLHDFPRTKLNLSTIEDTKESIPLLLNNGVNRTEISINMERDLLYLCLNEITEKYTSNSQTG